MSDKNAAAPNAVELTVSQAWYIAETINAGSFPWVLAITIPYTDSSERNVFLEQQREQLTNMGIISESGVIHPGVAEWIRTVCFPDRWLDLRYVSLGAPTSNVEPSMLRGIIARRDQTKTSRSGCTVVALRTAQLITFTLMNITDSRALVPVISAGLPGRPAATFDEFSLPARVGARADERLRLGTPLPEVLQYLGISSAACRIVESVFTGPRAYVEIVAGCMNNGQHTTTQVGMSVMDAQPGRILISPTQAFDGEWISTFRPGTDFAIAVAIEQLASTIPDGCWFPDQQLSRDFTSSDVSNVTAHRIG